MTDVSQAVSQAIDDSMNTDIAQPGSLAAIADAAFDKAVAAEGKDNEGTKSADTTRSEGESVDEPETGKNEGKDDAGGAEVSAESDGDSKEDAKDDEGYYADEGQDEVVKPDLETPAGPTDMGSWVLEQLPIIHVVGTSNGEQVGIDVKRAEDLPTDFEFSSKRDELIFSQNIADQTNRAVNLINKWNSDQQQASATKFSDQENRDIQLDIASLQREGLLNRFRYQPNDERFEKDPAVQAMQEVLDYYNAENQKRYAESQRTGRLFSRLSYRDAFYLQQRQTANDKPNTPTPEQTKADRSRKASTKVLAKGAKSQGDVGTTNRPRLRRDAGVDEIIEAYGLEG